MPIDDVTRNERLKELIETTRQAKRRDRALLHAPVVAPEGFSSKEIRRLCLETKEEFLRRR